MAINKAQVRQITSLSRSHRGRWERDTCGLFTVIKYYLIPITFRHTKSINYILRHSCVLLAGIYSTQNGFPIKDLGNDGIGNENGGNLWVIRKYYSLWII